MATRLSRGDKRAGFTLVEFVIAMAITAVALAATVLAFRDATQVNQNVALNEDMADNMRAGLNLMEQDLIQTATGIPTGGIAIPAKANSTCTSGFTNVQRPTLTGSASYPNCNTVMPAIEPGFDLGPNTTDQITILYQDNSLNLSQYPINPAAGPGAPNGGAGCAGSIDALGASAKFDTNCVTSPSPSGATINPGDLLLFSNANGNALVMVTSVAWPTVFFAAGDPFGLNQTGLPCGTLLQLRDGGQAAPTNPPTPCSTLATPPSPITYPPTTVERITMVTYYLDNTSVPGHVELIRRINFNNGQTVGDTLQNLKFTYNFSDGVAVNETAVPAGYSENQIRSVTIALGALSDTISEKTGRPIQTSVQTQVSLRSMTFYNQFP
jgi:prepilin-type N-terminal cleavage/methylation domain-containing protein